MNKLIINNRYFNNIIINYFENNKYLLKKYKVICDIDSVYQYKDYKKSTIINHINDYNLLGDKYTHYSLVKKNINNKNKNTYNFLLKTYLFNKNNVDILDNHINESKIWIIKPRNSYGRDMINIIRNKNDIINWINNNNNKEWIIQKYVDNPLLWDNKKFHIRIYALIIINNNNFKILIYDEGFIYLSYNNYDKLSNNLKSHLSGENDKSRVIVFNKKIKFYNKIWNKIKNLVKYSILPLKNLIKSPNNNICYKFLGFDILIDNNYNVYLAEINSRLISLKYPPKYFKKRLYTSILDAAYKNNFNNIEILYDNKNINIVNIIILTIIIILIFVLIYFILKKIKMK